MVRKLVNSSLVSSSSPKWVHMEAIQMSSTSQHPRHGVNDKAWKKTHSTLLQGSVILPAKSGTQKLLYLICFTLRLMGTRDTHECFPLYCLHQWGWKGQVCCSQCPELSLLFGVRKNKTDLVDPRASAVSQHLSLLRGDDDFAFAENRCPSHKTTYLVIETHRTVESSAVHHSCTLAFLHCYAWTA